MENLENLSTLKELWLGRNRIRSINLCGLKCIKKLSLQSNRLTSMTGLEVASMDFICCDCYRNTFTEIQLLYEMPPAELQATVSVMYLVIESYAGMCCIRRIILEP